MSIRNNILIGSLVLAIFLMSIWFKKQQISVPPPANTSDKVQVAASFYPLYFFATEIGQDQVEVSNLTPAGAEPHDYEPNAQDITHLQKKDLILVNGAGFEPWLEKVQAELSGTQVKIVTLTEGLATLPDPHVWLDPVLAQQEVVKIKEALQEIDPAHHEVYEANAAQLVEKLSVLDQEFRVGLTNCAQKNIVTSHQAFAYLAARYGLQQVAITGISPDQEPSPAELAAVVQFAKANQIKYIFFETLVSPRLAETLANEVGAQTLVFDPLEGLSQADQATGRNYLVIQRENLNNLRRALECT